MASSIDSGDGNGGKQGPGHEPPVFLGKKEAQFAVVIRY
jgi:hypothetical protein